MVEVLRGGYYMKNGENSIDSYISSTKHLYPTHTRAEYGKERIKPITDLGVLCIEYQRTTQRQLGF